MIGNTCLMQFIYLFTTMRILGAVSSPRSQFISDTAKRHIDRGEATEMEVTKDGLVQRTIIRGGSDSRDKAEVKKAEATYSSFASVRAKSSQAHARAPESEETEEDEEELETTLQSSTAMASTTKTTSTASSPLPTPSPVGEVDAGADVDCQWETWAEWSACQFTCGGGESIRTRKVRQMAQGKGAACDNNDKESRDCNTNPCPIDCVWDEWAPWGSCSATCGLGTKVKTRDPSQLPEYGGKPCVGNTTASAECQVKVCPVDCKWSDWGDWEGCSKSCGVGERSRYRSYAQIQNAHGKECPGQNLQTETCGMNTCPVDCAMEDWQAWEPCDVTCGEGTTRRERKVLTLPVFGGERCGAVSENKTCDNGLCPVHCLLSDWTQWADCSISCTTSGQPGSTKRFRTVVQHKNKLGDDCAGELEQTTACSPVQCPVDCKMTDWTTWSDCSSTCGPGVVERQRDVASSAQYGGKECVGAANETYQKRYCSRDTCPVDCQWSDWQDWRACSVTCGSGSSYRMRLVQTPMLHGGKDCDGGYQQTRQCNPAACPVHCEWGDWAKWGNCSSTCGEGTETRSRDVKARADFGGEPCSGNASATRSCDNEACPVNCQWADWEAWQSCSASCGTGLQTRERQKAIPAEHGGADCEGLAKDSVACSSLPACPVDCEWDDWSQWEGCSVTCGSGFVRRTRTRKLYEKNGGHVCYGTEDDEKVCALDPCPVDCILGDWARWSDCSVTCGPAGQQTRSRGVVVHGSLGGKACNPDDLLETTGCEDAPCPIHCEWATWGEWSKCTKECNGGTTFRHRSENVSAEHGGRQCEGSADEEMVCNAHGCPVDCKFEQWTDWSDCSKSCSTGNRTASRTLITPPQWGGQPCDGGIFKTEYCNEQPCPVDCSWGEWSNYALCSKTCGGGQMERTRESNPELYGGKPCDGLARESTPCNTQGCPQDCEWGQWTTWTPCSKECGGGSIKRFRDVVVKRAFGGDPCVGASEEEAGCNFDVCAVHCEWNDWEAWSPCPATCNGGVRSKSRTRKQEASAGGKPCAGNRTETERCNSQPCPVDCSFELWQEWGDCSASCGVGSRFRTRVKKAELYGGAPCQDVMWEVGECSNPEDDINCPYSTSSTTTTLTLLQLEKGQLGWSHLHNVWEPHAERGPLEVPGQDELSKNFSISKDPSYKGAPYKPTVPCPKDKLNQSLEIYEKLKLQQPDLAKLSNATQAEAMKVIDKMIQNITGEVPQVNYTYNEVVLNRTTAPPTMPPPSPTAVERTADMDVSSSNIKQVLDILEALPSKTSDVEKFLKQVEQNLSSSSGSRPFQASGNFSEYLSKEAAEAPDTPASRNFTDAFETADSKQDGRTVLAEIAGDLGLDVIEADDFVGNPSVSAALAKALANLAGAESEDVKVDVTIPQAMLLSQVQKRIKGNVNVAYMIEVYKQDMSKGNASQVASRISTSDINTVTSEIRRQVSSSGQNFALRAVSLSVTILPVSSDGNIEVAPSSSEGESDNTSLVEDAVPTAMLDGKAKAPRTAKAMVETAQRVAEIAKVASAKFHPQTVLGTDKDDLPKDPQDEKRETIRSEPGLKSGTARHCLAVTAALPLVMQLLEVMS
ncbi:HMCN1 [Symbiodinium necroappetens]|uniref:HMCN1 protein n=1 Tax=Symbiodinium necroappetens TaxID=1628268 RepID=A0A813BTW9_9DINO|nr:HMCN1 [Symbiodinium necroappetens]